MSTTTREYAAAGVDPTKTAVFKEIMIKMGKRTLTFPQQHGEQWGIEIDQDAHAASFRFAKKWPYKFKKTKEGLGNKAWIAQWMYQHAGTGQTYHNGIGIDTILMAVNDVIAHGARPFIYVDEVATGSSDWFADEKRGHDIAESFYGICETHGIAMPQGESPANRYVNNALPPVTSAPSMSGCVTGFIARPEEEISGHNYVPGSHIIGVTSSGLQANGVSLVIKRALTLADQFLTVLPNSKTLGEEALIPTRSYYKLVRALQNEEIEILGFLPGTGDGVAKLATADKRGLTYYIHSWVPTIPPLFLFLREIGVTIDELLRTFNWGVGYWIFVRPKYVQRTIEVGQAAGYELFDLGVVKDGPRQVIFGPEGNLILPPGDIVA